jgi:pimeloyl-ACP methyl ester carboxylesterase
MKPPGPALWVMLALCPFPAQAQDASPITQSFRIAVAPGETLHVVTAGSGDPVVLVPGLFGCAFGFRHLLSRLPALGYRAIVIEPLAVGSSSRPERADYSLTAQADRIAAAIERTERRPVLLVAHSLSASMALRLGVRHPALVRGIVLLDGGPMEQVATKGFRRAMTYAPWVKWLGGMKRLRPRLRHDLIASSADTTWLTDQVLQAYTAGAAANLDGTLKAYLRMAGAREPEKLEPRLQELGVPVRLVVGSARHQSGISPEQITSLAKRLPRFAIDSVGRAGHYLYEEAPDAVISAIRLTHVSSLALGRATEVRP